VSARQNLTKGLSKPLDAAGNATIELGPTSGPVNWEVTSLVTQTNRVNKAPIPRVSVYLDTVAPENVLCVSPNGSFGQANGKQQLSRGSKLVAVWTGGQVGDLATLTVNGEQWS
jgi:hypothetical protein